MRSLASIALVSLVFSNPMLGGPGDAAERLTGGSHRVWVLQRTDRATSAETCRQKEAADFSANHSVTITKCESGQIESSAQQWSIRSDGVDDWITVAGEEYQLLFSPDGKTMLLRTLSKKKLTATVNKTYRRQGD